MYRELNTESSQERLRSGIRQGLPRRRRDARRCARSPAGIPGDAEERRRRDRRPGPGHRPHRRLRRRRSRPRPALRRRRHRLEPEPGLPRAAHGRAPRKPDRTGAAGADPRRATAHRWPKARPKPANTRSAARRSTSPAKSGCAEEDELPALARQGFPPGTPVGISGVEQAFNARLAGTAGRHPARGRRSGGSARIIAKADPEAGAPVKTTIDPDLQEAAVSALAGRAGGVAVLDARRRRRPRARRPGLLRPAAARLDLQDDHHDRRPAEGRRLARRRIRNHRRRQRRRPLHQQRQRRALRRHLPRSVRRVLQRRLRPARARRSATTTSSRPRNGSASTRRRRLYAPEVAREAVEPAESTIPTEIGEEVDLGVTRDRPGRGAGDAAGDGEHRPDDRQRRRPRADLARRQQEAAARQRSRSG